MYSTCLYCHRSLGHNEAIEHFTVGRRLAFDSAKGRLWAVCPSCQRWNLTPLEERWEAVEECERAFRNQRLRAETDNIGLAKLRDRTELVRIGRPLRPELAAWRYGRVIGARCRRRVLIAGGAAAVVGASAIGLATGPIVIPSLVFAAGILYIPAVAYWLSLGVGARSPLVATRIVGLDDKPLRLFGGDIERSRIVPGHDAEAWTLFVKHSYGHEELTGDRARCALAAILARANRVGAPADTVEAATDLVVAAGSPNAAITRIAVVADDLRGNFDALVLADQRGTALRVGWMPIPLVQPGRNSSGVPINLGSFTRLPPVYRLALEMSLHDATEQRALDGELSVLENEWREAEEVAAIADSMFVPRSTTDFIKQYRQKG